MHRRGMIIAPKKPVSSKYKVAKDGYVELKGDESIGITQTSSQEIQKSSEGGGFSNFFGFMDSNSETTPNKEVFSSPTAIQTEIDAYSKREADEKIEKLDSLIYKLEQRIEVLERKLGTNGNNW